jgi:hypothetical protein
MAGNDVVKVSTGFYRRSTETDVQLFQLFSALEELEVKRRNPASELPIKWNQGVVNQENPENQLGRTQTSS